MENSLKKKIINPWNSPPTSHSPHRVLHLSNLPNNSNWNSIKNNFDTNSIEFTHFFSNQALIQFINTDLARNYISNCKGYIPNTTIKIQFSCIYYLDFENKEKYNPNSKVICIQVVKLRLPLSIFDIYDECSLFGTVEKIICFEKTGKFALVQMKTFNEASLAMNNLSNSPRHNPGCELRVQFSKIQDIAIKFNNNKSFDFTIPNSIEQFEQLRNSSYSEPPFFEPEKIPEVPPVFELFKPVHFDPAFTHYLNITNIDEMINPCDKLRNLFSQYGPVYRVKSNILKGGRSNALILMANGFYARLAAYFIQGCPLFGRKIRVDLPLHLDPAAYGVTGCETTIKDYQTDVNNGFIGYEEMWIPSEFVRIYPNNFKFNENINMNYIYIENRNVIKFNNIEEAAIFIATYGNSIINGVNISLRFTNP